LPPPSFRSTSPCDCSRPPRDPHSFPTRRSSDLGQGRIMAMEPESLDQRVPLIFGSRREIERIERYHAEFAAGTDKPYRSPLFAQDRKSTRLNSSHVKISYAVFCLKKKNAHNVLA